MPSKASSTTTEEYVTMTEVHEMLEQQKDFYKNLLGQQEKSFKSCVHIIMASSNKRTD